MSNHTSKFVSDVIASIEIQYALWVILRLCWITWSSCFELVELMQLLY